MRPRTLRAVVVAAAFGSVALPTLAAPKPALDAEFTQTVKPFVAKHCLGCHSGKNPAAQFDLNAYDTLSEVTREFPRWSLVMERLEAKDMPPKPVPQPPSEQTAKVVEWIRALRAEEIRKFAGDPGLVPARRLSNAEYNYTIRDLTGQDLQVTREFPVDPANPAGFDNSGESLTMSPALLNKYLQAARSVASHLVLTPDGFNFAPHPMLVETDREKYAIQRILDFYESQPTRYAPYFEAAWRYKNRSALGKPAQTLAGAAKSANLSPKYMQMIWQLLQEPRALGPVAKLQKMWLALPAPSAKNATEVSKKCVEMQEFVSRIRNHTAMQFAAPKVRGLPGASQPLQNWKLRQFAANHRKSDPKALRNDTDPEPTVPAIPRYPGLHQDAAPRWAALMAKARASDPDLVVPAGQRMAYEAAFDRFAAVFPDKFYITERGRYFPDDSEDKGRFLSAGYHNVMGYYRDDTALAELVLDDKGVGELNRLWNEFDYIASFTERTWVQFFYNQSGAVRGRGAESGTARPEGHEVTDPEVIAAMRDEYLAKAAADAANDPIAPQAMRVHFDGINATLRGLEIQRRQAEAKHLNHLLQFAERAFRRPATKTERDELLAYYQARRKSNQLSHEDAIRETVVGILMSLDYLFRLDLDSNAPTLTSSSAAKSGQNVAFTSRPLPDYALANRLSYFLWSSMPDEELLKHAAAGDLHVPTVLLAQTRRMLKDPRVRGLATEFTGNWLSFRQFQNNNSVDRERFPEFNNDLRDAMFQEPVRVMEDALANNRPILDLLYGDYTFVNPPLAKHYGMPEVKGGTSNWVRVDSASQYGRGGLLPMAVFLTQNSPGLRTSPVKRGNWVVQRVLGEVIPPPPPVVPELPNDEAKSELPVRDMLAKHRENALCAACHARIDSFGIAFEGYGPVGNARTKDLAGRAVDTVATYPGGLSGTGVRGLQDFIRNHRQKDFVAQMSRKLLSFALNRSLQISDEPVVERMIARATANQYRFGSLVETIVTSPQFLNKRVAEPLSTQESDSLQ